MLCERASFPQKSPSQALQDTEVASSGDFIGLSHARTRNFARDARCRENRGRRNQRSSLPSSTRDSTRPPRARGRSRSRSRPLPCTVALTMHRRSRCTSVRNGRTPDHAAGQDVRDLRGKRPCNAKSEICRKIGHIGTVSRLRPGFSSLIHNKSFSVFRAFMTIQNCCASMRKMIRSSTTVPSHSTQRVDELFRPIDARSFGHQIVEYSAAAA